MAINGYVGLPGSGKSYGVVEHVIIPSLKQNRLVVTNIPLDVDALLMDFGGRINQLDDDWHLLEDLHTIAPNGCVLVLDEVWSRFPAGLKQNQLKSTDSELLMKHRHLVDEQGRAMRIVLVTQDLQQIASGVRALIDTTYRMTKLNKQRFRVDIYKGAVTGNRPPKNLILRQTFGKYQKQVYQYYKSATQSKTGDVGDESSADSRNNFFKSGSFWAFIIMAVLGLGLGTSYVISFFSVKEPVKTVKPVEPVKQFIPPKKVQPTPKKEPEPTPPTKPTQLQKVISKPINNPSFLWRVSGFVKKPDSLDQAIVILSSTTGHTRQLPFEGNCKFIDGGHSVSCLIDDELITPWTGATVISQVMDASSLLTK